MSDWKNNRPKDWEKTLLAEVKKVPDSKLLEGNLPQALLLIAEAGADAMYKAIEELRPSNDEIKARLISCLYGGSDVPELLVWLKEKLLVKE